MWPCGRAAVWQMVKDDLGLKRSDLEAIKRRLVKQGITDVVAVSTSF